MHIAQNWRMNGQRYSLKAVRCQTCDKVIFPHRDVCPHCAQQGIEKQNVVNVNVNSVNPVSLERAAR